MVEFDPGKKILVTGANGFIGKRLTAFLSSKSVLYTTLDRDIFDNEEDLGKKVLESDVVIHLAALIRGTYEELHNANFGNTKKILNIISETHGKKPVFIYPSSFAVYGTQKEILKEDSLLNPRNDYGKSKLEVEKLVGKFSSEFGITSVILRLSNVYGLGALPYTHSVIATFVDQAKNNKPFTINGTGEQTRDFVYIDDAVKALWMAACYGTRNTDGELLVANICSAEGVSLNNLIYEIGRMLGIKTAIEYVNKDLPERGCWVGDNNLAFKVLGWKPETNFLVGLKKSYEKT